MDNAEKQVAFVYLISLWIDMKRSKTTLTSQEYTNILFNIEENISLNLGISPTETKIMLDHKMFCESNMKSTPCQEWTEAMTRLRMKLRKLRRIWVFLIKQLLELISAICKIESEICRY